MSPCSIAGVFPPFLEVAQNASEGHKRHLQLLPLETSSAELDFDKVNESKPYIYFLKQNCIITVFYQYAYIITFICGFSCTACTINGTGRPTNKTGNIIITVFSKHIHIICLYIDYIVKTTL